MDSDDALVGTIMTRRRAMRLAAQTGLALAFGGKLLRTASAATTTRLPTTQPRLPLIAAPELTEGPFFVDEKLNRSDLVGDTNRVSVATGLPLVLGVCIYKLTGKEYVPLAGATVDVWHADAAGHYSDEANPMNGENTSGQTWLRGYQTTDVSGQVQFRTIFPGWYRGRAPHVHFKVRVPVAGGATTKPAGQTAEFTSQFFFQEADIDRVYAKAPYNSTRGQRDTRNENDGVYSERTQDGTPAGQHMLLDLLPNPDGDGHAAIFPIVLTDASLTSGHPGFGGPGGPPGGGFGDFGPPSFPDQPPRP